MSGKSELPSAPVIASENNALDGKSGCIKSGGGCVVLALVASAAVLIAVLLWSSKRRARIEDARIAGQMIVEAIVSYRDRNRVSPESLEALHLTGVNTEAWYYTKSASGFSIYCDIKELVMKSSSLGYSYDHQYGTEGWILTNDNGDTTKL